jgi:hypothetical protein
MGKKTTKTTQTNKPIYAAEVENANRQQQDAYIRSQPMINGISDAAGRASISLFDRFSNGGDPATAAASDYITRTLSANPQNNPYLDQMVATTGDNTRRAVQTQLGTRGGVGGSAEREIVSRQLAQQELAARYADFERTRQLQANAAGMAPGIAAAGYLPLQQALSAGEAGSMLPLQAALANSAGTAGLLGQYQTINGKQVQTGGLLESILGGAFGLGSAILGRRG